MHNGKPAALVPVIPPPVNSSAGPAEDSTTLYLNDTGRKRLPNSEEEMVLAHRVASGEGKQ